MAALISVRDFVSSWNIHLLGYGLDFSFARSLAMHFRTVYTYDTTGQRYTDFPIRGSLR